MEGADPPASAPADQAESTDAGIAPPPPSAPVDAAGGQAVVGEAVPGPPSAVKESEGRGNDDVAGTADATSPRENPNETSPAVAADGPAAAPEHADEAHKASSGGSAPGSPRANGAAPEQEDAREPIYELDSPDTPLADQVEADERELARTTKHVFQTFPDLSAMPPAQAERLLKVKSTIEANKFDTDSWVTLLDEATSIEKEGVRRTVERAAYDEMLAVFPTAADQWKRYADLELAAGSVTAAKAIFAQCLVQCFTVGLFQSYIRFIRAVHEPKGPDGLVQVRKAFEFALDRVGQALDSGPLWEAYVTFLKGIAPDTPEHKKVFATVPGQEVASQREALRRAYQRALRVPQHRLDMLWREYERFEQTASASPEMARKMIEDMSPVVTLCRVVLAERTRLYDRLPEDMFALPPGMCPDSDVRAWKAVLQWEKKNTQRLDADQLRARVTLAYEQSLQRLFRHPDMWHSYAAWHLHGGGGGTAAAILVLARAAVACPGMLLFKLWAAEIHERAGEAPKAQEIYEQLLAPINTTDAATTDPSRDKTVAGALDSGALSPEGLGEVLIQYMHFLRRTEGILSARKLFASRAVKWPDCPWTVFAAAALMDWHHDRNTKAVRNIFEFGAKRFLGSPGFVREYARWLASQGDDVNARNVMERALDACPPEAAPRMWDVRLAFESEAGNTTEAAAVEDRRAAALAGSGAVDADWDRLVCLLGRYKHFDVWPSSAPDRVHIRRMLGLVQRRVVVGEGAAGAAEADAAEAPRAGAGAQWAEEGGAGVPGGAVGAGATGGGGGAQSRRQDGERGPPARRRRQEGAAGGEGPLHGPLAVLVSRLPTPARYVGTVVDPSLVLDALQNPAVRPSWPRPARRGKRDLGERDGPQGEERGQRPRYG